MPAAGKHVVLPSFFANDKDLENQVVQYSSFNHTSNTCTICKSGGNTGQKSATENSDKVSEDDPKSLFLLKSL